MSLRVLQLAEDLKDILDTELYKEDKDSLRRQVPTTTVHTLLLCLDKSLVGAIDQFYRPYFSAMLIRVQ